MDNSQARLIAAAPMLYEALKAAFDDRGPMWDWVSERMIGADEYKRRSAVIEQVRAALRAAEEAA